MYQWDCSKKSKFNVSKGDMVTGDKREESSLMPRSDSVRTK